VADSQSHEGVQTTLSRLSEAATMVAQLGAEANAR
jgi:hypothetical protein